MEEERSPYTPGDWVEVVGGPFAKAKGVVRDVNAKMKSLIIVMKKDLNLIGAGDLPVEFRFQEVKKIAS